MPLLYESANQQTDIQSFFTPLTEAIAEVENRRRNSLLCEKVEKYLAHSIPDHFKNGPILYLARHIATPNFETLYFIEQCKSLKFPTVIGQDLHDKFVSKNPLKRALGKMPIQKGVARNFDDIIEYFTIVDFAEAEGEKLKDIQTFTGISLADFHNSLFREIYTSTNVAIVDEADWIDKNGRGDLLEHYKKMLALFLVHGVMFEYYPLEDKNELYFVEHILAPAFTFIENTFGIKPLIVTLVPSIAQSEKNWDAYPSVFYQLVKKKMQL